MINNKKNSMIPYGQQWVDGGDIQSVVQVLQSDWLTTGPMVEEFENSFSNFTESKYAVAVNSGTAALHCAMFAVNIQEGDEVIVPSITFAATANCIVYLGGTPIFADVLEDTLLIDPIDIKNKITHRTKAIIAVDYAGQPANYKEIREIASQYDLALIADACHAIGGSYFGKPVGSFADLNTFSFHPVKHITTGEGGMVTTSNKIFAERMKLFRNHGITSDHRQRAEQGSWFYEMEALGYNYRINDFQCALGISQLKKLPEWVDRRQNIADKYNSAFDDNKYILPLKVSPDVNHAYHLYVVRIKFDQLSIDRTELFVQLKESNIGTNVHYIPVYLHPFYQRKFNLKPGFCPIAESAYEEILSLPLYPKMANTAVDYVISTLMQIVNDNIK